MNGSAARRRAAASVVLAGLVIAAVGCSSSDSSEGAGPSTSAAPARSTTTQVGADPGDPCAWPTRADKATLNVAYPDTGATYWVTSYDLAKGEHLELRGRYPDARYSSFITYGASGGALDVLTDRDIEPDEGSTNPFAGDGGEAGGRFTVEVRSDTDDAPNALTAVAPADAPEAEVPATSGTKGPARLGTGEPGAAGVVSGTLIYRIYLSGVEGDPMGGEALPDVRLVDASGKATDVPTCAEAGPNPAATDIINANGPATDTPPPAQPIFIRPGKNAANLYPNPDNVYVATILGYQPGRIAVIRAKAPTFPNTGDGDAVGGDEQVRYWSLCTNEYRKPYPVSFCVADHDVALDESGSFTIVVSTDEDRPANATSDNGITWLEWGDTSVDNVLLLRHMLADPAFPEAATNLAKGDLAVPKMGAYAPVGVYCEASTFASGGPDACPAP